MISLHKKVFNGLITILLIGLPLAIFYFVKVGVALSENMAINVFTTLIQANATFIGFFGIIMIFNWTKSSNLSNMLMDRAIQTLEKIQLLETEIEKNNKHEIDLMKEKKELYDVTLQELSRSIKKETKERVDFGNFSILPVSCFFVSIFISIIGITQITNNSLLTLLLSVTFSAMSWGIVFTLLSMASSYPNNDD